MHDHDDMLPEAMPTRLPPPLKKDGRGRHLTHRGKKLPSANYAPPDCPNPEFAWQAASLMALGKSKRHICESVGISYTTLRKWETSPWWDEIYVDVVRHEHGDLKAAALEAAMALCESRDGATVRFLLERLDPQSFGPPKIQAEIRAETKAQVEVEGEVNFNPVQTSAEHAKEIAEMLQSMGAFKHHAPTESNSDAV